MKITAKEANDLIPHSYINDELIFYKIKSIAESGLDYFWTDLTLEQVALFKDLGYKVEPPSHWERSYKISWAKPQ